MSSVILEMRDRLLGGLFPEELDKDERFLVLAICGEAGELANLIKKRWRDHISLFELELNEEIRDEIADIRVYLELIAALYGIEGEKLDKRVEQKLAIVAERRKKQLQRMKEL